MVSLDTLTIRYRQHPALHQISGHFAAGSLTAVVGPNGSGKSTLLKSIMGLLPRAGGRVDVAVPLQRIAYLPQLAEIDRGFPMDVRDCVLLGCWPRNGAWRGTSAAQLAQVDAALQAVGLDGFAQRPISSLSSGQLQRVMFARLVVQDAELILLDEPFNAMDSKTTAALLALIRQWHAQQRTVVTVLHDDALVRECFPQTLLLAREVVAWGNTAQVMTEPFLRRARAMAEAWDHVAHPQVAHCVCSSPPSYRVENPIRQAGGDASGPAEPVPRHPWKGGRGVNPPPVAHSVGSSALAGGDASDPAKPVPRRLWAIGRKQAAVQAAT